MEQACGKRRIENEEKQAYVTVSSCGRLARALIGSGGKMATKGGGGGSAKTGGAGGGKSGGSGGKSTGGGSGRVGSVNKAATTSHYAARLGGKTGGSGGSKK